MEALRTDIDELASFLSSAKSARNAEFLKTKIAALEAELEQLKKTEPAAPTVAVAAEAGSGTVEDLAEAQPAEKAQGQTAAPLATAPVPPPKAQYVTIVSFGWDQGDYNSDTVSVYIRSGIDGVEKVKDTVSCDFTEGSFDLKIHGLNGKNYRLLKDNLDKDIVPGESKIIVKKNRITIKLKKVKGEYGFDHWTDLTAKRKKTSASKKDPTAGIMDMMKDMYDSGDDTMKKAIGEAMMKSREQQASGKSGVDDMDMGGMM